MKIKTVNSYESDVSNDGSDSIQSNNHTDDNGENEEEGNLTETEELTTGKHKTDLKKLKKIDPEFYKYLQSNDRELLEFGQSESESENEENEKIEKLHKPPESLEVASDESDFEDEEISDPGGLTKVSLNLVKQWEKALTANKRSIQPVSTVVRGFRASLIRVTGDVIKTQCSYKVDSGAVFNEIVRLCVTSLYPYIQKLLHLPPNNVTSKLVEKSKNWPKLKPVIRAYIVDLNKLISNVASADVLSVLLKHLHQLMPLVVCLPTVLKPVLKRLTTLWSTNNDDTVRVVSFLCILRLDVLYPRTHDNVLKVMYANYISNAKFVSPHTLSGINFMRRCLTQMFELNLTISYNHAFLYIRQLAIHLRSAVMLKKKESMQTVYTWRYIASLQLWVDVLCATKEHVQMQSLIYPTIQVIIGCIKLIPTAQYLPLRFHCIQMLNKLCMEIGTFIPVLPFLLEVLTLLNVNTPHSKLSMKPMDFTCILRVSKSQMQENAFKDAVIDHFYQHTLEYLASESHRISFPDLVVPAVIEIKHFLKQCKNANYTRKIKSLVEKVEENSKVINSERLKCGIPLTDEAGIAAWELSMKSKGTPLGSFYLSWLKIHQQNLTRKVADTVKISEFDIPTIKKPTKKNTDVQAKTRSSNELFPSDDEDDGTEEVFNFGSDDNDDDDGDGANKDKKSKNVKPKFGRDGRGKNIANKTKVKSRKRKHPKNQAAADEVAAKKRSINIDIDEKDIVEDLNMAEFLL